MQIKDSWVHNNLRGGLFAQTAPPSPTPGAGITGTIKAAHSLIEQNGVNCPNGAAAGFSGSLSDCGTQLPARLDASGISTQQPAPAALQRLETDGNVIRDGSGQGILFGDYSKGAIANDYVCGMHRTDVTNPKGILIKKLHGAETDISVQGTAVVYNVEGTKLDDSIPAIFGDGGANSLGNNAFTQNGASVHKDFINVLAAPVPLIKARGNQWQSCYTSQSDHNFCKTSSIKNNDLNVANAADVGRISPDSCDPANGCQPHQALGSVVPLTINPNGVDPTKVSEAGPIVHITGTGFDAISGHTGQSSGNCGTLKATNKCSPLQGTCVQFLVDGVPVGGDVDVLAVTPTHLVVKSPIACSKPVKIQVKRLGPNGFEILNPPQADFCTN